MWQFPGVIVWLIDNLQYYQLSLDPITAKEALLWKPNQISNEKGKRCIFLYDNYYYAYTYIVAYFLNMANKLADEKGILPGGSLNRDNEMVIIYYMSLVFCCVVLV